MELFYDPRDDAYHERLGGQVLYWLDDLPLLEANLTDEGFLFAGAVFKAAARRLRGEEPELPGDAVGGRF